MHWQHPAGRHDTELEAFLREHETGHVPAAARFLDSLTIDRLWLARDADGGIRSFAYFERGGSLLPVLSRPDDPANDRGLRRLISRGSPFSVQGAPEEADAAERAIAAKGSGKSVQSINYRLMSLSAINADALNAGPAGLRVRRALPNDAESLMPLQRSYELEEVLPAGVRFDARTSRLNLDRLLRTGLAFLAELNDKIIAKANVNARSFTRDQIGGIYVLPECRGHGIARALVAGLTADLSVSGRTTCLFVKTRNLPAIAAYRAVGFTDCGAYDIRYFR